MEAQAYLIGAAVVLISAILIYLIAIVTMREKSYDDILAEQRKRREDFYNTPATKSAPEKPKQKKKAVKKRVRPERVDVTDGEASLEEQEQPTKMVELELEPEIIEDAPKPQKGAKAKKQKPILLNKQEKVVVSSNLQAPDAPHHRPTPKDSVALKQEKARQISETMADPVASAPVVPAAPENKDKVRKREKREKREAEMQKVNVEEVKMTMAAAPTTMEQRTSKKTKEYLASGDSVKTDGAQIVATVQAAHLNNADIQALIEVLLSKQGGSEDSSDKWKTKTPKGDPVEILEKQLTEKNQELKEEKEQSQVAMRRLKEIQQEQARERQQYGLLEKDLNDKMSAQLQDIQALQLRMQNTHEQHRVEVTTLKMQVDQRQGQINDGQTVMLQRLKEENMKLQDKASNSGKQLKIVQDELNKQIQERGSADGSRKQMEAKLMQYEDKIRKLENNQRDTENVLTQKYKEVSEHFQREQAKSAAMGRDLEKANNERHHREQEIANMRNLMKDLENVKGQREQELNELQGHLHGLREENTLLATDLKTYRERTSGEGQEAPTVPQGAVAPVNEHSKLEESVILRSEHDQVLRAKDFEINQLKADVDARLAELSHMEQLTHEIDIQKKKNNDLRQKNWKAMDALSQMEKKAESSSSLKTQLESKDNEISKLVKELSQLQNHTSDLEVEKSKAFADTIAAGRDAAVAHEQMEQYRQQLDNMTTELQTKYATLSSVQHENDGFQRQIQALESTSWSAAATAEELCQLQQTVQNQSVVLQQREELLKFQDDKISQGESLLQSQTLQFQDQDHELQSFKGQLYVKDEELESCRKQLVDQDSQWQTQSQQLAETQSLLKLQSEEQSSRSQDFDVKSKELQDREAALQQQGEQLQQRDNDMQGRDDQMSQHKQELDHLRQQLEEREQSLAGQSQELHLKFETQTSQMNEKESSLEEQSSRLRDQECATKQQQQQLQDQQDQLQQQLEQVRQEEQAQCDSLRSALESQKNENEDLRGKNWKAMDALQQAETRAQTNSSTAEELTDVKNSLKKLFPSVQITESKKWLVNIEQHIKQEASTSQDPLPDLSNFECQLSESRQSNTRLEGQVQHYKSVLADTESILNQLQNSVESEEQKWIVKLRKTEDDLKMAKSENFTLSGEVNELKSGTQSITKISELQYQLTTTENENHDLQSQLSQSTISLNSMKADLEEMRHSSLSDNVEEAHSLSLDLEDSLKKLKEIKSANVKLTGQLKIGQEALRLEQVEVKKLKEQIEARRQTLTNGSPVHEDVDELKEMLASAENQLAKEAQNNQQLTQKLGASAESESSSV